VPLRLNALLASNQQLRQFASKARQLSALQQLYESLVPPAFRHGTQVIEQQQQTLIIAANNGAVAAKLRHMSGELISLFQAKGCEITGIQIRVQVATPLPAARPAPRKLGKAAREALGKLDENLAESPLKAALERLLKS
jgi:hypothetical protein